MNSVGGIVSMIVLMIIGLVALSFLLSYPLMLLWNGCLVGAVDGVHNVGWLQMWGLTFLFSSLFKSMSTTTKSSS